MKSCESAAIQGAKREIRRCLAPVTSGLREQKLPWHALGLDCCSAGVAWVHMSRNSCSILKCLYFQGTLFIVHACHTTRVHLQIVLPRTRERQLLHVQLCFVLHEKPCRFRTCLANHSRRIGGADVLEAADSKEHGELKYTHLRKNMEELEEGYDL